MAAGTADGIVPIVMPKWGLAMREGKLADWLVEEGATIAPGQEIMEVETDKIANAVEAADGGLLRRRVGQAGETYPVKALLGVLAPESVPEAEIDAFVAAWVVPAPEADAAEAGPAHEYAETPQGRLRYETRPGPGAPGAPVVPIVFIHGFGGDLGNWMFNIDAVAAAGPAIALDLPGHGGSAKALAAPSLDTLADAAASLLDGLGHREAHLVGHSMGGAVAGLLALRGRAKTLTLIDTAGLGPEIDMAYIDGFVSAPSRRELKPALQHLFADPGLVGRAMVEDLMKYKRLDGAQATLEALAAALFGGGVQRRSLVAELSALTIPVQVIWGERDAIVPASHARALPNARTEVIAGVGHMPQMEAAGRVNELIRAIVAG